MSVAINIHYGDNMNNTSHDLNPSIIQNTESKDNKYLDWFSKIGLTLFSTYSYSHIMTKIALGATEVAKEATSEVTSDTIRASFSKIIDIFSAIAEPILWGYAIVGLVLVATGNKQMGWARVKQVAYAYIGVQCLPAFFAFLRYLAKMLTASFS